MANDANESPERIAADLLITAIENKCINPDIDDDAKKFTETLAECQESLAHSIRQRMEAD